jgi:hypothetical protein
LEAKVVGVTDCESNWLLSKQNNGSVVQRITLLADLKEIRKGAAERALEALRKGCGIDIDECNVFLEVCALSFPRIKSSEGAPSVKVFKLLWALSVTAFKLL